MEKAPTNTTLVETDPTHVEVESTMSPEELELLATFEQEKAAWEAEFAEAQEEAEAERELDESLTTRLEDSETFLDGIRDDIATDELAQEWYDLGQAVQGAKTVSDLAYKLEAVTAIEQAGQELAEKLRTDTEEITV